MNIQNKLIRKCDADTQLREILCVDETIMLYTQTSFEIWYANLLRFFNASLLKNNE